MNDTKNFNIDDYRDSNFEEAYNLCEKKYSHEELIDMLKKGNVPQKQIAGLNFDYVNSIDDARILISNLTGCDGKIRETIAYKINSFIENEAKTHQYFAKVSAETFAKATIDINANICRLVVNSAYILKNYVEFSQEYIHKILQYTNESLEELDKFIYRDKKYVINKQLFKLYWCLEAIMYFQDFIQEETLYKILEKSISQNEYTIREKCAKIVNTSNKFPTLKEQLENDENYYVKQIFTSSKHL